MAEGQFTGERCAYVYVMEDGTPIQLVLDRTIAEVVGTGLVLAQADDGSVSKPINFTPRGVYWQGELDGKQKRKFLPCSFPSPLYGNNVSAPVTIDGVVGRTTGRVGEKLSFARYCAPTP